MPLTSILLQWAIFLRENPELMLTFQICLSLYPNEPMILQILLLILLLPGTELPMFLFLHSLCVRCLVISWLLMQRS
uniref:Uncharacterized protein n=2 Tax=Anguilla anguilla TaxID=7936 RepID=A0A0E9SES4_ANGAN